jgi:hypothetical protein
VIYGQQEMYLGVSESLPAGCVPGVSPVLHF